ncbi:hypothetical protein ABPG74_022640 [Tetrahymena malaccensis]
MGNCCGQSQVNNGEIPSNLIFNENQYLAMAPAPEEVEEVKEAYQDIEEQNEDEKMKMQNNIQLVQEEGFEANENINFEQLQQSPIVFQQLEANNQSKNEDVVDISSNQIQNTSAISAAAPSDSSAIKRNSTFKPTYVEKDPKVIEEQKKRKEAEEKKRIIEYYANLNKEYEITKIQALYRSHRSRQESKEIKENKKVYLTEKEKAYSPNSKSAQPYQHQKVVLNQILQKLIDQYGKFNPFNPEIRKNQRVKKIICDLDKVKLSNPYVFINSNGIYTGEWKRGLRHGYGTFVTENQIYEGYWEENYASGYGRTIFINGDMYEGDYFKDQAQGQGIYITKDKSKYEGQFSNNKPHGYGKESWFDGSKFVGTFSMGKKQGEGKFHFRDGSIYHGNFENNMFNGKGKYVWPDGREYEGLWKDNQMHGEGVYTWPDGRQYTGPYINGKRDGTGYFKWPKGESYQGQWRFGVQHGVGFYTDDKKVRKKGYWKFGKFQGFI